MSRRTFLIIAVILMAVTGVVTANRLSRPTARGVVVTEKDRSGRMTLRKLARREKKKGNRHVVSPMGDLDFAAVETLEHAPRLFTAVIAEADMMKAARESPRTPARPSLSRPTSRRHIKAD